MNLKTKKKIKFSSKLSIKAKTEAATKLNLSIKEIELEIEKGILINKEFNLQSINQKLDRMKSTRNK